VRGPDDAARDPRDRRVLDAHRQARERGRRREQRNLEGSNRSAGDGHVAFEIDFKAIDALAADNPGSPLFEWDARGAARRWKAFDLEIATDSTACPQLRLRVRNK
jgi:hypothetical protein